MPARKALPYADTVMRFASKTRRLNNPDGTLGGPSPAAYALDETDKGGLSVTWIEHFGPFDAPTRAIAAAAYRESLESKKLGVQGAFAWASVKSIVDAGAEYRKTLRVVHDPVNGNPGHAEVRHFNDDDLDLLEYLQSSVFEEWQAVGEMAIPPRT